GRNGWHCGGNDIPGNIIALANMSFRAGTPYPSMSVLVNVVRRLIPRVALCSTLGCLTLAVLSGLVLRQTCVLSGY
ncbi:MAG: hypothetical protein IKB16_07955, partial [Lentisphaeria bacterium]|nr:hypothetical protein [Lentisphaeria bacterium]